MEKFIQRIVRKAGEAVLKRFGKEGVHYIKSKRAWDIVTKADLLSERIIVSAILGKYPEHGIISEERGRINDGAEYVWIIDPIDGTLNYVRNVPMFGVMVCLVHRGEVVLSAVSLPATNELFFAKVGGGAYRNGRRIHCSVVRDLAGTFGAGATTIKARTARFFSRLLASTEDKPLKFSSTGSMASNACYTASGGRDWIFSTSGSIWDFAPTYLILKESGCKVTDASGKPWKFGMLEMLAANPALHKQLLKLTKNV